MQIQIALNIGLSIFAVVVQYVFVYVIFRVLRCKHLTAKWISIGISMACYSVACVFVAISIYDPNSFLLKNNFTDGEVLKLVLASVVISMNLTVMPFLYWLDKRKALIEGKTRIPEVVLHFFAFSGGAIGALVSQRIFNHKTTKQPFRGVFRLSFVSSLIIYILFIYAFGIVPLPLQKVI